MIQQRLRHLIIAILLIAVPLAVTAYMLFQVSPLASASANGVLVEYQQTGGIVGIDDMIVVFLDGRASVTRSGRMTTTFIRGDSFERLAQRLEQSKFHTLNSTYSPAVDCCDLITYRITYKGQAVWMTDTAIPGELQPVIDILNEIMASPM